MQAMAEDVEFGVFPVNEFTVEPDIAVTEVKRDHGHRALHKIVAIMVAFDLTGNNRVEICQHH